MRSGLTDHYLSPLLPFQRGTLQILDAAATDHDINTFSGISRDGKLTWLVRGNVIVIVNTSTRQRVASWGFGVALKDTHSYITCVTEYSYDKRPKLLVGVCNALQTSMVCVLDIRTSKVSNVIEIPHKISSIEAVTNVGGDFIPRWALNDQLRMFHGIIAVGTISGIVYLIDMCMDEEWYSDEVMPSKLQYVTPRSRDTEQRRKQAMSKKQHLCLVLDEESHGNQYKYRRCDGTVLKTFNIDDVVVSCLKYIPQIGTLVVGFSFGSYQLWKLNIPVLEYSSRVELETGSVQHVAYQEPENDPKNFCYLWIVRGGDTDEEETISSAALYQLSFNRKTWYSNYGAFYEELTSVSLRFDIDLTSNVFNTASKTTFSSKAITCYTLENPNYTPPARLSEEESFEESVHGPDLSRCVFVWEAAEGSSQKTYQMAVFDMNRWYHAQMPSTIRCIGGNTDTCSYMSVYCIDGALDISVPDALLSVYVQTERLRKFINTSPLPPEQHFYPSSLDFDAVVVVESGIINVHILGKQSQVFTSMEKMGPSILLSPKELYNLCIYRALLPRPLDVANHNPTAGQMRDSILTMALEYNMRSFIIRCIQDWAPGEYVHHGCTLKSVLDWAWSRVVHIKSTIDKTCIPLYDWSGVVLDNRSIQTLQQSYQKLLELKAIFTYLINQSSPTTNEGAIELQNKLSVIVYVSQHLQVVLWFIRAGLLPEYDEAEESLLPGQYSYPAGSLVHAFRQRRQELQKLHEDVGETDLLLIDGLVEVMGPAVKNLWYKEGGNGLYPPPSLHALLNIYLLEGIDLSRKHALVLYCLLDLVSLVGPAQHEQFSEKIGKFTKALGIPVSLIPQVQTFWLLDHKDFDEGVEVILKPNVPSDLGAWQHFRIIKSLLYQGEGRLALKYISSKDPPLSSPEEVKMKLTVLLANRLTGLALQYQRTYRDIDNMEDLLQHLFLGCQQTKTFGQLLQLPLTDEEEKSLIEYLNNSKEPQSQELLLLHYLNRARYVEAIQLNEKLKHGVLLEPSSKSRERASARNALIEGYLSLLPTVQRKLIFESQNIPKKTTANRREVRRPQPLSTTVTKNSHAKVVSRSSLYLEILERVQEVKYEDEEDQTSTREEDNHGPFICTPITPRTKSFFSTTQPVVYLNKTENDQEKPVPWHPSVTSVLTPFNLTKMMSPVSTIKTPKIHATEILSMLQTPVPLRKSLSRSLTSSSIPATPQSILKVRQVISNKEQSPPSSPTRPIAEEVEMEVPGTPRSVSFRDSTIQGTPKQLRFVQKQEESVKSPKVHKSILRSPPSPRSVKDRSPTPESISRSPKHKSNLDILQRPPLHGDMSGIQRTSDNQADVSEVAMDTHTKVVDDEITFNLTHNADSGDETTDSSTEVVVISDQPDNEEERVQPPQVSILKKSDLMSSPVKLRHSPLKVVTPPRSPTVKLTRSPARGMIIPQFSIPDDENAPPAAVTSTFGQSGEVGQEEPIEIEESDEEEALIQEDSKRKPSVSFGGVFEETLDEGNTSSDVHSLLEKVDEIENRITSCVDEEEVEDFEVSTMQQLKPQNLFKKKRERSIHFVLPDSSSDKDNKVSSEEELVIEETDEEIGEIVKETVTTTHIQLEQEISDESDMEVEGVPVQVQGEPVHSEEKEDFTFSEPEQLVEETDANNSALEDITSLSKSEATIVKNYSNFVDTLTKDFEVVDKKEDDNNEEKQDLDLIKTASELKDQEEIKSSEDSESPVQIEMDEEVFDKKLPPLFEVETYEEYSDSSEMNESKSVRKPKTRQSTEPTELRRSSRRLSSVVKFDATEYSSLPKSPGRKKKVEDNPQSSEPVETPKSPSRRKSIRNAEELDIAKSPSRRKSVRNTEESEMPKSPSKETEEKKETPKSPGRRKSVKNVDEVEILKSPGRRKSVKDDEEMEVTKSPGRRKSMKKTEETEIPKSPGRRKSVKNAEDVEVTKSPGRRKSVKNTEETEIPKSPGRRKSVKNAEEIEIPKSPGRIKSVKNTEETEIPKSPGRRKSVKNTEEIEVTKSPGRRKSVKNEEEMSVSKSPGRRKKVVESNIDSEQETSVQKSPARGRGRKSKTDQLQTTESEMEETEDDTNVTKSTSRRKKTTESFTAVKSPSRKSSSSRSRSRSPGSQASTLVPEDHERSENEITPSESEIESPKPRRGRRSGTPAKSAGKVRLTPSRRWKRQEVQSETSEISETESEGIAPPVFSFSDPMQVDIPTDDFTKVKDSSDMHSFIFSPPAQTRTKRLSKEPSQLTQEEPSILLPPSSSRETTPMNSRETTPLKLRKKTPLKSKEKTPLKSREGTPVKSASKRGRGRRGSDISVPLPIPEEPPGTTEEEPEQDVEPPPKVKRSKRGKRKLLNYDEVNLISPIKEEEGEVESERPLTRQQLKRSQEMPTLTLRGKPAPARKKRAAKLW